MASRRSRRHPATTSPAWMWCLPRSKKPRRPSPSPRPNCSKKGVITAEQKANADKIQFVSDMSTMGEADLVIEAATENPELKFKIFKDMDANAREGVILATNTSSISITKIAAATKRPDKVIGMHFMNPVPLMKLVEIIRGLATTDETTKTVVDICKVMGKEPVEANDSPGLYPIGFYAR